ncbi:Peptidase M56 BlaR1 [Gillisia limnaea]|uniref:Peptidase M56 BlaR1 n=2 Tax=Gillisia TaxID=244698 RepID=H2C051_GILLR|nr:peptidase M56 BlaR1 [Gillisia limnaea DSM 15749]
MYLVNSAACLAILLFFYKLLLENETIHQFKRFYLLGSVFIAFVIPFITFKTYIEVSPDSLQQFSGSSILISETETASSFNWSLILWGIYGIGVLIFSIKFSANLIKLIIRIRQNPKLKNKNYINVLLRDKLAPHTFFNYLFFNKEEFINKQIPPEVIMHEEAHSRQLHSLDILLMEILQIVFWFNPLIYLGKNAIKLNHEFLADQAVIKNGMGASNYQKTLLAFSSNAQPSKLANAFNYSSTRLTVFGKTFSFGKFGQVKKRFKVMKTHTSRTSFWVRSLLLLPLMALLFYGFSDKAVVVKDAVAAPYTFQDTVPDKKLTLHIEEKIIIVNGKITNLKDFAKTINEITRDWKKEDFDLYGLEIKVGESVENSFIDKINAEFRKTNMAKASVSNSSYIPRSGSLNSMIPDTPPASPKMEDYLTDNSKIYLEGKIISTEEAIELIITMGKKLTVSIRENGKNKTTVTLEFKDAVPPPPAPPKTPSAENGNLYTAAQSPPPPNSNTLEYIKELAKRGANFYIGPHKYSPEEAIKMVKKSTNEISIDVSKYPDVILGGC